jgi:hypothetical protein
VRTISAEERRARLARRHHLAKNARSNDFAQLAGDMAGLHATDPASVYLAARARMRHATVGEVERVLYKERRAVRMLGMRRTMFVVPLELAAIVQAACTDAIAVKLRERYARMLEQGGITADGTAWLDDAARATLAALEARGEAFAAELSADVPMLREKLYHGEGKKWAGSQSATTFVLSLLAAEGRIVRGRPRGSWTSSQHRWVPARSWLPAPLPRLDPAQARTELVRRWLGAFGPGTIADLRWWTGLPVGPLRSALGEIGPVEVDLGGATGFCLSADDEPEPEPEPWVALLPALDPTVMGWKERGWYLGEHGPVLFDSAGNAGPTVWSNGRIVGAWAARRDGAIVFRLLEDVGSEAAAAIEAEAEALTAVLEELYAIFAAAPDAAATARLLNAGLARHTAPLRLIQEPGAAWHLHAEPPGDDSWAGWFAAASLLALAVHFATHGAPAWGVCSAWGCRHVYVQAGPGRPRTTCSPGCAAKKRQAELRARRAG